MQVWYSRIAVVARITFHAYIFQRIRHLGYVQIIDTYFPDQLRVIWLYPIDSTVRVCKRGTSHHGYNFLPSGANKHLNIFDTADL